MSEVTLEKNGDIAVVRLNNGITNAIGPTMVEELDGCLEMIRNEFRGLVLTGGEKFFCIGLELPRLLQLDYDQMYAFWDKFNRLILDIYSLPHPTTCAVTGHAPGAGAVLALACEFRIAGAEKVLIGFNEIQLGIPTPYLVDLMLRKALLEHEADDLLYSGKLVPSQEAKNIRLVHECHAKEEVIEHAIKRTAEIAKRSTQAYAAIKNVKTAAIKEAFEKNHKQQHEIFLRNWFSEPTQELLKAALKNF